ncbi:uncharacterized protein LOC110253942 [Exaiptasia diaphana]|uniref:Uncharacterized protein n=1 Tax=Exaiptasia diaphana TaxID=2652724 RepID=A0A913Y8U6_EXADI|nr:uncharacterized protein LOC110253942 [Exaiptasia diaphana]
MAFQFGSTTRLRHMNYPENQPRVSTQWDQTDRNTLSPLHKSAGLTLEGTDESTLRSQELDKANSLVGNHRKDGLTVNLSNYRADNASGKIANKSITIQTNYSTHHLISRGISTTSTHNPAQGIEIDVLESFSEFAAFLEIQNPICPAEHLDTPEKLMSVLSWDVWVQ